MRSSRRNGDRAPVQGQTRFMVSVGAGLACGAIVWAVWRFWVYPVMAVVIIPALTFTVWTFVALWRMDGARTRRSALAEDVDEPLSDLAVIGILAASLTMVGILLFVGSDKTKSLDAGLAIIGVLSVWACLHTIYSIRYARIFYHDDHGGIDFNSDELPCYQDFFYFGFNLGMTYQVSDNTVSSTRIRAVVMRHGIMSFLFGTMVVACTINLVVSLAS